jgi:hypothetical protein
MSRIRNKFLLIEVWNKQNVVESRPKRLMYERASSSSICNVIQDPYSIDRDRPQKNYAQYNGSTSKV